MENSVLEAPAHRLLVVHREHELRPTWRGRRAARLQFHAAVGIHPRDPDGFAYRGLARRGWRHPPHIAPLLGGRVGVRRKQWTSSHSVPRAALSMTTRSSRRTTTESVWSSNRWATEVGEPLSLL